MLRVEMAGNGYTIVSVWLLQVVHLVPNKRTEFRLKPLPLAVLSPVHEVPIIATARIKSMHAVGQ